MKLTERDQQILSVLCNSVRMMSLEQLANHWWQSSANPLLIAGRRLKVLTNQGMLCTANVVAADLPAIERPVVAWVPGGMEPDFGAVAWQLQNRWKSPPANVVVYVATPKATKTFGGKATGKIKHHYQATHDLGVAQMYLRYRETKPQLIQYWIGEDELAPYRKHQKLPDAIIAEATTRTPKLVVEFGGAYDKERVTAFHRDCEQRALPYEIW